MAYVYQHIRLDTDEVFYIGIGSDKKYNRAHTIKGRRNPHWHNVVNKVGYRVEILSDSISWEEACKEEKRLIKLYGRIADGGILTNITEGGDGVWGMRQNRELLDRLSKINKGDGNPMFGKTHTIESREKMGVNKGRTFDISDEERERRAEVRRISIEIKELKASLTQTPNIITIAKLLETEEYLKSIKKERMKRYERVKAKRNPYEAGHI